MCNKYLEFIWSYCRACNALQYKQRQDAVQLLVKEREDKLPNDVNLKKLVERIKKLE